MAVTVVPRRNLQDNHAAVAAFGRSLAEAFADWARQPVSATLPSLTTRLQTMAEGEYEAAFLRGKRQALPKVDLDANDIAFVRKSLQGNREFLKGLEWDIAHKVRLQKLEGGQDTAKVVTTAFQSRIENLFGGTLWHMQEAGFAAGVKALATAIRSTPRPIAQETLMARVARLTKEREDSLLATQDTLERDRPTVESWNAAMAREIAQKSAAADSAEEVDWSVDPPELAFALNLPEAEVIDTLMDPGFRIGTKYNAENDAATCDPCRENSMGGEDGDGIYWEPDSPPFPGEDCDGYGNCRCTLETVYGS